MTVDGTLTAGSLSVAGGLVDFTQAIATGNSPNAMSITTGGHARIRRRRRQHEDRVLHRQQRRILVLGSPATFAGKISGFNGTDYIDLLNTSATGLSYVGNTTNGVLTVTDAIGTVATLNLVGNYNNNQFRAPVGRNGRDLHRLIVRMDKQFQLALLADSSRCHSIG